MSLNHPWMPAEWPCPKNVHALTTKRFILNDTHLQDFNLATYISDYPELVAHNCERLNKLLHFDKPITWLNQVHGKEVVRLPLKDATLTPTADASFTTEVGVVCAVLTADCLPIVLCDTQGEVVCAIHGGWRSLQQNIIQESVNKIRAFTKNPIIAWMGPGIGQDAFEVGSEVREAFLKTDSALDKAFRPSEKRPDTFHANLYNIATHQLHQLGIEGIYGGGHCSYSEPKSFYSARRNFNAGRMATLIWKTPS